MYTYNIEIYRYIHVCGHTAKNHSLPNTTPIIPVAFRWIAFANLQREMGNHYCTNGLGSFGQPRARLRTMFQHSSCASNKPRGSMWSNDPRPCTRIDLPSRWHWATLRLHQTLIPKAQPFAPMATPNCSARFSHIWSYELPRFFD